MHPIKRNTIYNKTTHILKTQDRNTGETKNKNKNTESELENNELEFNSNLTNNA